MKEKANTKQVILGERLQNARELHNYSQTELARMLNVSRASINAWEHSVSQPSINKLLEIASLLDVGVDYLLGTNNVLAIRIDRLNTDQQKAVCQLISAFQEDIIIKDKSK